MKDRLEGRMRPDEGKGYAFQCAVAMTNKRACHKRI